MGAPIAAELVGSAKDQVAAASIAAAQANFSAKSNSLRALATRLTRPPILSIYGNSIVAGVYSANLLQWAIYESGLYQFGANFGVAGDTTTQMLARVSSVTGCDGVLILEGANDARTLAAARLHYDNLEAIIKNLLARGIVPAIVAASPYYQQETYSAGYLTAEQLLCLKYGLDYYDPWISYIDVTNGRWVSGSSSDNIHPLAATQDALTPILAALLRGEAATEKFVPRASIVDASNCSIIGGNQLLTSFGTSNGQPAPAGWTVTGATPFTGLQIAAPSGHRGNFYRMTSNGAGSTPGVQRTISSSLFQVGDQIAISFYARYTAAANSTLTAAVSGGAVGQIAVLSTRNFAWARYTAYFTIASATNLVLSFGLLNSRTGGVFEVGEVDVINLTKTISR